MSATADKPTTATYMSWATLENLWERLDKDGVPPKIDRSILGGSEGYKTQVLAGLKWLELIEADGKVTPRMARFIDEPERRQELVANLFREKYPTQIELGANNASQRDLEASFQPLTGDTARKAVSFYLKGARFADLPLSSYFVMPRTRKPTASGAKPKRRAGAKDKTVLGERADDSQTNGLHPALAGLLNDLPRHGQGWTEEERSRFQAVWDAMLAYAIPVVTDDDAEDSDDAEDDA